MKLQSLVEAMNMARKEYELNADDLAVLLEVGMAKDPSEATVMKITAKHKYVSSTATIQERVHRLCKRGFLTKTESTENMRYKFLALGPKVDEFLTRLETL